MDESQRKQLAERIHGYSSMPGIPEQIQNDLIQASVLIHANKTQEEDERKIQEPVAEEPTSLKYLTKRVSITSVTLRKCFAGTVLQILIQSVLILKTRVVKFYQSLISD